MAGVAAAIRRREIWRMAYQRKWRRRKLAAKSARRKRRSAKLRESESAAALAHMAAAWQPGEMKASGAAAIMASHNGVAMKSVKASGVVTLKINAYR